MRYCVPYAYVSNYNTRELAYRGSGVPNQRNKTNWLRDTLFLTDCRTRREL